MHHQTTASRMKMLNNKLYPSMKERRMIEENITTLPDSRKVEGYAVVFNSESRDLGGFVEVIEPRALEGVLEQSDILCLLNHNEDKGVLARSNKGTGTLELSVDERGLKYSFDAPNTSLGDELLEGLRRGDITNSSFAFTVGEDKWTKRNDGMYLRTISHIKQMFDVSPVYRAAYDATSVKTDTRGMDEMKAKEKKELEDYYKQLRESIR